MELELNMFSLIDVSVNNLNELFKCCFTELIILLCNYFSVVRNGEVGGPGKFKLIPVVGKSPYELSVEETNVVHHIVTD